MWRKLSVNIAVAHHQFRFHSVLVSEEGNIIQQTLPNLSVDTCAMFTLEIMTALHSLSFMSDRRDKHSHWT